MPYYMGDFYGYGRARGDPGFLGFLGGLAKKAVGFIPGVGPIASAALGSIGAKKAPLMLPAAAGVASTAIQVAQRGGKAISGAIVKHPVLSAAAAAGTVGALGGVVGQRIAHHIAAGGRRRRRMNVCNPRALRRSLRRTMGFAKLAMRTIHLVHPRKKARFGGFRKHRAKARV
jgi:hypothetical protein